MPYEFYKVLHILSILIVFSFMAVSFLHPTPPKFSKIITGVGSFFILVAGMGLLARLGVNHGEGFPVWVWAKIGLWLLISALGPVLAKRLKQEQKIWAFLGMLILASLAVVVAVFKP